jgi:DNA polymerase-3 subunit alpha
MKSLKNICIPDRYTNEVSIEWKDCSTEQKKYIIYLKNNNIKSLNNKHKSHVLYALGITDIPPVGYIERSGGGGLCDIDVDFEKRYRDQVIEYVSEKYGRDKVAHIGTFNMLRSKAAVRSVTKTLGHPYQIGDNLSKLLLPPIHGKVQGLKESIERVPELYEFRNRECIEGEILKWAEKVEGLASSVGVHASGIVISNNSLYESVPLFLGKSEELSTQWEMGNIEDFGLIKFDFLGLDALTKIHRCIDLIEKLHNVKINIDEISLEDDETFSNLRAGDSVGIFQLEASSGMRDLLVQIRPTSLEDITALVAIYRPGPLESDYKQTYLNVRAGIESPSYLIPELEPILKKTGGWLIYQEQVLRIAQQLAGYSMADADLLRRAIGKKKEKEMLQNAAKFKEGWIKNGYSKDSADEIWDQIVAFANYAFNKSHAAAYALITYQTAWLKTHYPTEFMCAIMISEADNQDDIIKCINECKRLGITISSPNINSSHASFWVTDKKQINFGLGPITNLGEKPVELILQEREKNGPFKSFKDFCTRVNLSIINKLKLESLIYAGAFDGFGETRASLINMVQRVWDYRDTYKSYLSKVETYKRKLVAYDQREAEIQAYEQNKSGKKPGKIKAPELPEEPIWPTQIDLDELSDFDLQTKEHELLGCYVTSHPLDTVKNQIGGFNTIEDIKDMQHGLYVSLGAVIVNKKEITTSTTKKKMAFFVLEDLTGTIEATCFAASYERYKDILIEGIPLRFDLTVEVTETDESKITKARINKVHVFNRSFQNESEKSQRLYLTIPSKNINLMSEVLKKYQGNMHDIELKVELEDGTYINMPAIKIGEGKNKFLKEISSIING